jgi:hypothetical protein
MNTQSLLIVPILLLTGCGTKAVPQAPISDETKQPSRAELRIGNDLDEPRHLPFKIVTAYGHQKRSADAPYHIEGGGWMFFDCQTRSDPGAVFTVGVASGSGDGKTPSAWGKAVLIVKDREAGARFVEEFAGVFSGKLPTPLRQAREPVPLPINVSLWDLKSLAFEAKTSSTQGLARSSGEPVRSSGGDG